MTIGNDLHAALHLPRIGSLVLATSLAGGCVTEGADPTFDADVTDADADVDEDSAPVDAEVEREHASHGDHPERDHESSSEEIFGVAVGELVEVEDGIALPVPEPGQRISAEVIYADGVMSMVTLAHTADGRVLAQYPDDHLLDLPAGTSASCLSKCLDPSYSFVSDPPAKWKTTLQWYYRTLNSPVAEQTAIDVLEYGARAVPTVRNDCSVSDQSSASESYQGTITGQGPGVQYSGGVVSCNGTNIADGTNVVGWGSLPSNTLGVACWVSQDDATSTRAMIGMGIKFNKDQSWFTGTSVPPACSSAYSLRAVATHEFGHVFGLGHSPMTCNLTMAPSLSACTSGKRKFGYGDTLAIHQLY